MTRNRRKKKQRISNQGRPENTYDSGTTRKPTLSPPRSSSLLDSEFVTEELSSFESLRISPNPRSFPNGVKQLCWEKAEKIPGRDPDRCRRDPLGNIVFRKFVGCPGCLCHDYDHIVPYSKGGQSTLENCQVLQATVNRSKGNCSGLSEEELIPKSSFVGFQDAIWILLKRQPMAIFIVDKIPEDCI